MVQLGTFLLQAYLTVWNIRSEYFALPLQANKRYIAKPRSRMVFSADRVVSVAENYRACGTTLSLNEITAPAFGNTVTGMPLVR